jgi:small subunit ribosomal protein S8
MMTDPIGDMLTRIRNAGTARHRETECATSKLKMAVARVLSAEGFVGEVSSQPGESFSTMTIGVRYRDDGRPMVDGIRRISTPGRRVYVGAGEVPLVRKGLGMAVLSTPQGVMCDRDARDAKVGGEVICEVW